MPLFLTESNLASQSEPTPAAAGMNLINDEARVRWLISFLSVDNKKTFCLYEAATAGEARPADHQAGPNAVT